MTFSVSRVSSYSLFSLAVGFSLAIFTAASAQTPNTSNMVSEVSGATKGVAPGGIFVSTSKQPLLASFNNLRFDAEKRQLRTDDWTYPVNVSQGEVQMIFKLAKQQNFLAADVNTKGDTNLFGIPEDSRIAKRLVIADMILGDIGKGWGYFAPLYQTANNYQPKIWEPSARGFSVFFYFQVAQFNIENKILMAKPAALAGFSIPTIRQRGGTRLFDMPAVGKGIKDEAIEANTQHIMQNESYYRREPAVRDVQIYAELLQIARDAMSAGVKLDEIIP